MLSVQSARDCCTFEWVVDNQADANGVVADRVGVNSLAGRQSEVLGTR